MTSEEFVQAIRLYVMQPAIAQALDNLQARRNPECDRAVAQSVDRCLFGLFAVLDGVRAIEDTEDKGRLELWYKRGSESTLLNSPDSDSLHDLFAILQEESPIASR